MNLLSNLPKECNINVVNLGLNQDFKIKIKESDKFYQFICNLLKEIELAYCLGPCLNPDQITKLECQFKQNVNLLK
jgi:hypothetical protein